MARTKGEREGRLGKGRQSLQRVLCAYPNRGATGELGYAVIWLMLRLRSAPYSTVGELAGPSPQGTGPRYNGEISQGSDGRMERRKEFQK